MKPSFLPGGLAALAVVASVLVASEHLRLGELKAELASSRQELSELRKSYLDVAVQVQRGELELRRLKPLEDQNKSLQYSLDSSRRVVQAAEDAIYALQRNAGSTMTNQRAEYGSEVTVVAAQPSRSKMESRIAHVAENEQLRRNEAIQAEQDSRRVQVVAQANAESYFWHEWKPGNASATVTRVKVTTEELSPVSGWTGHWNVRGTAYVDYYISSGSSFSSNKVPFAAVLVEGPTPRFEVTLK